MSLRFMTLALRHFAFLKTDYGLWTAVESSNCIRWESRDVFVEVCFDSQRSFELEAFIGRVGLLVHGNPVPYGLDEIARCRGGQWGICAVRACNEQELDARLGEMAAAMRDVGRPFLRNDDDAYVSVSKQRARDCAAYARGEELRQMRAAVALAWQAKDYELVKGLYENHLECLTASERKRYEIALNRTKLR